MCVELGSIPHDTSAPRSILMHRFSYFVEQTSSSSRQFERAALPHIAQTGRLEPSGIMFFFYLLLFQLAVSAQMHDNFD